MSGQIEHNLSTSPVRRHILGLDGLRGLAILSVFLHNVGYFDEPADSIAIKLVRLMVGAGWIGVQLFFVLSGFLITGILLDTKRNTNYFRSFYIRRVLRIFPLYYLTLIVAFLVLPHLINLGRWGEHASRVQIWYWSYLMNWSDPFVGVLPGLSHFWSLAVEEQFYLVWPFVVFSLSTNRLIRVCGFLIVSALLTRIVMVACDVSAIATYSFTISRWDALACGAAIAIVMRTPSWYERITPWIRPSAISFGGALLLVMIVDRGLPWSSPLSQTAGYSLLTLLFGLLLMTIVKPFASTNWLRRMAESRLLRFFGKYSYGIYVLHWPIHRIGQLWLTAWVVEGTSATRFWHLIVYIAGNLVASTAAAVIVWHGIERRFLALKDVWGRKDSSVLRKS